jgi:NADP-dependent 3-hydroxy acid dehydrogenase YdfG
MTGIRQKVIAITGVSSGIGAATTRLLGASGAHVVLGARRKDRLSTLAADIREHGGSAEYCELDVTHRHSVAQFADFAVERFGRLDVMINNAGIMLLSPLGAAKFDEWDRMIDVNFRGILNGIAAALPKFIAQGSGHFVNVASLGSHYVVPTAGVYCATKFAAWAITDALRQEHRNIRATIITPSVVDTEVGSGQETLKEFREGAIAPEAIARAVRYAIEQPDDVDVSEIIVRPTAHSF